MASRSKVLTMVSGTALAMALSVAAAPAVHAQDSTASADEDAGIGVIIVTAQRRQQNLQDVPIAITAFSDESIARSDLTSVDKLNGQVPNLRVTVGAERTNLSIRGIGSTLTAINSEAGVPLNIDGVYMTRTTLNAATFDDLDSMEVLRGPQGTLYGRNATGGAVNLWTKKPGDTVSGDFTALVGNGDRYKVKGAVSVPLAGERLALRTSLSYEHLGGYINNLYLNEKADPEEHISGRVVLRAAPNDDVEILLRASISSDDVGGPIIQYQYVAGPNSPTNPTYNGRVSVDPRNLYHNTRTRYNYDDEVYSGTISWNIGGSGVTLKSVTAYQKHKLDGMLEGDGTDALYNTAHFLEISPAFTQEVTLSGSSSRLQWVVGGWYMDDEANQVAADFYLRGATWTNRFKADTTAYAAFAQATYNLTDALHLTAGLRYSKEKKVFTRSVGFPPPAVCNNVVNSKKYDDLSPKFGIDYQVNDNVLLYASVTKGFKAGGGNTASCTNNFGPEELWAYESGIKTTLFDRRLRLNIAGYYYDYSGYQSSQLIPPATSVINNAADAKAKGLEIEVLAEPVDGLTLELNAAWQDTEFGDFITTAQFLPPPNTADVTGNRLVGTPEFSGNMAAQYELPLASGVLVLRGEHEWSSKYYFDVYNNPLTQQDSYGRSNARLSYRFESGSLDGFELAAYVKNIENKDLLNRADGSGIFGGLRLAYDRPRTYGLEMRYHF